MNGLVFRAATVAVSKAEKQTWGNYFFSTLGFTNYTDTQKAAIKKQEDEIKAEPNLKQKEALQARLKALKKGFFALKTENEAFLIANGLGKIDKEGSFVITKPQKSLLVSLCLALGAVATFVGLKFIHKSK